MVWSRMQNTYHSLSVRLGTGRAIAHLLLTSARFLVALRRVTTLRFNGLIREAESKTCICLRKSDEFDCENGGCVVWM